MAPDGKTGRTARAATNVIKDCEKRYGAIGIGFHTPQDTALQ